MFDGLQRRALEQHNQHFPSAEKISQNLRPRVWRELNWRRPQTRNARRRNFGIRRQRFWSVAKKHPRMRESVWERKRERERRYVLKLCVCEDLRKITGVTRVCVWERVRYVAPRRVYEKEREGDNILTLGHPSQCGFLGEISRANGSSLCLWNDARDWVYVNVGERERL